MFDVIWTDPDRELVGERRARKEVERESREKEKPTRQARNSISTRSSSSSSDRPFGFFGNISLKRTITPLKLKPSSSHSTPSSTGASLATVTTMTSAIDVKKRANASSPYLAVAPVAHAVELPSEPVRPISGGAYLPDPFSHSGDHSPSSSSRDSIFSKWADNSVATPLSSYSMPEPASKSSVIQTQTIGPSSFVTKSTEVTVLPRTPENDVSHLITEVTISSDGPRESLPTPPLSPTGLTILPPKIDSPVHLVPGSKSPQWPASPAWSATFKPNNPDAWRPPDAWDCGPAEVSATSIHNVLEENEVPSEEDLMSLDLHGMQRELRRMAAATPDMVLLRLREVWGSSADAAIYKEMELEKKRWMLSALHHMDSPDVDTSKPSTFKVTAGKAQKVLALYESQATASYLAALHHSQHVYHVSSSPLSHVLFPNVHPVLMPTVSASAFPVAAQLFGAVYSLALPALLSSQEIPQVLKHVRRCLVPGGTFHLTIIDPMPVASTLGPRMRAWLDENLLLNLERQFRCINPSRVFPIWLHDASLRGEGSTITTVKFQAVPDKSEQVPGLDEYAAATRETKVELRSLVGRMLWMEVWGAFVGADRWWWEDPLCVQECIQLGTYWEYNLIEAVKETGEL